MLRKSFLPVLALCFLLHGPAMATEERASRTRHTVIVDGQTLPYTATAGTLLLKNEDGTPGAEVFHVAYTLDGVKDLTRRPVMFCFNGGPGGASLWLHLGAFGPRRVALDPEGMPLPPPSRLVNNEDSLLDVTDLVFVDPVSTGYSRAVPGQDPKRYHGLRNDVESMADFIRLWLTRNGRWGSPRFVAGESYATVRSAGLAAHLLDRYGLALNGVVLIAPSLNRIYHHFDIGNDLPHISFLPTYTAAAWYHKKLPPELAGDLRRTLAEVEAFALEEYGPALLLGDRLPPERRKSLAEKLARYTGLSLDYIHLSDLRVEQSRFAKELLRDRGRTLGRLDTRFLGTDRDAVGEIHEYDAGFWRVDSPFVSAMHAYLRDELRWEDDRFYERLTDKVFPWEWTGAENRYVDMSEPLRQTMMKNPALKVFFATGAYDMAAPYFETEITIAHMRLPAADRSRVRHVMYEAGHMPYFRRVEHHRLKADLAAFMREAMGRN